MCAVTGHGTPPLPTRTQHPRSKNVLNLTNESQNLWHPGADSASGTDGETSDYTGPGGTGDSGYGGDLKDWQIQSPETLGFNELPGRFTQCHK